MTVKIQKWGNSWGIRFPASVIKETEFEEGEPLDLEFKKGLLKVEDKRRRKYTLKELVDQITPENLHPATDWGPSVGKERFWEDE